MQPMKASQELLEEQKAANQRNGNHVIEVEDLHKFYEISGEMRVHALRGLSATIDQAEFAIIMGASGSGKSTFMNLLGCLDTPSRGTYKLEGTDVSQLTRVELARIRNERVGFVFQGFNLLSRTTATENVELPLIYSGIRARERHRRSQEALERMGLAERANHIPSQLSGGQQQRVAIARALVNHPLILLADEPTGNLDSRTAVEIMQVLQELNEQEHLTIILVTHEPDIVSYGKRIITFRDGHITKDEPVRNRRAAAEVIATLPPLED